MKNEIESLFGEKKQLIAQFDLNQRLYNNVLIGFTDDESNQRINSNMNHVKYLAGHLLNSQYGLAALGGVTLERKWNDLFAARGKSKAKDNFPYPPLDEVKAEWNKIYEPARNGLAGLTREQLNNVPHIPFIFEPFENSIAGCWAFLNYHQALHIGQIAILRRGFGKEPMRFD